MSTDTEQEWETWYRLHIYVQGRKKPWTIQYTPDEVKEAYAATELLEERKNYGERELVQFDSVMSWILIDPSQVQVIELEHVIKWLDED